MWALTLLSRVRWSVRGGVLTGIAEPVIALQQLWDAVTGVVNWLSDPANWIRIGMILGGAALVMFGIIHLENA
jgi:hypothetical protein